MKIIDEHGVALTEAPDLTLGRLVEDVEIVHHDAVAGVEKVSHWVTTKTYPNGGREVEEVIDVEPVTPMEAWDETIPVQRYIRYTEEELKEQAEQQERQARIDRMPETVEQLRAELERARDAQTDTDSLMVDQEYRLTLLELGV